MSRVIIYPYKMGSGSAKSLQTELQSRGHRVSRVYPDRNFRPRASDLVINWGNSTEPAWISTIRSNAYPMWINGTDSIAMASNKLRAFVNMKAEGVAVPEFTTEVAEANEWMNDYSVLERHRLTGHSGVGINLVMRGEVLNPEVPLYVKYIKKKQEFRVHVFKGEVIDIQEKRKRQETPNEEVDYKVRSYQNGWVFCRENITVDESVLGESKAAVAALGLDFGAVDVIWNEHHQKAYVLEVNTACGLDGSTVDIYADAIESQIAGQG